MRVLIVEDDVALGAFLKKGLELEGNEVDWVGDGEAAVQAVESSPPDLMVLDLGLPRRDGIEVLELLRDQLAGTAVLVLTGRSGVEERVKCLNLGADDCLLKPFSFYELTARCRALLRRRECSADPMLRHGGISLHRMERKVMREGRAVELTVKEFQLLEFLMLRSGRCCTRAELLRDVWHMSPETNTNVVDVYVNYLRRKLQEACPEAHRSAIETVRGAGYRMAPVRRSPRATTPLLTVSTVCEGVRA